jgi:hypothetical protein
VLAALSTLACLAPLFFFVFIADGAGAEDATVASSLVLAALVLVRFSGGALDRSLRACGVGPLDRKFAISIISMMYGDGLGSKSGKFDEGWET